MSILKDVVDVYERLRKYQFTIKIENGTILSLNFLPEHFHHLCGFQHLTDLSNIYMPGNKRLFYSKVKNGTIDDRHIIKSTKYHSIKDRLQFFQNIEYILCSGETKIIVEFDRSKSGSIINARYYLYKREGSALQGNVTYYALFLGYDNHSHKLYPATYIVEHSPLYMRNQQTLNCEIIRTKK